MAKKTKVTTWISRDALRSLRDLAAAHQLTLSQIAADVLERGLKERAETVGLGLLGPQPGDNGRRWLSYVSATRLYHWT